ncbi:MAG TPA: TolC family protein [Candidatus Polarisedimenticolia bacterium]|nr:TolC family protein [Candidatus Polarisedimenticolia bacterium]
MRVARIAALAGLVAIPVPATAASADPAAPQLSLDEAIGMALEHNHLLAGSAKVVDEAVERTKALRTERLPALKLEAYELRWLNDLDFTFPAGALGSVPPLGPLPPQDSTFTVQEDYGGVAVVSLSQPITQQHRIGLGLEVARLDRRIAEEDLRRERQRVAAEVRTTYYQISATEQGIEAQRDLVRSVEELDAVTTRYLAEGLVLRSDALEVVARLALERQRLAAAENGLATQQEHLNQVLGRDVEVPFRVAMPSELAPPAAGLALDEARTRARASRAEIRRASLLTARAETTRRLATAGWIPDLSLNASYARMSNFETLPDGVGTVGLYFSWEPFDWGRKRHQAAERTRQTEQAQEGREESEQQITVEVGQRWRELRDSAALLEAMRLEQESTSASLDTDWNRYRENAAILRDVLRTEARNSSARHDFTSALADYWSALALLERAIGDEN